MFETAIYAKPWIVAVGVNTVLLAIAFLLPKKLLTPMGYLNAWLLGVLLWGAVGWQAFAVVMAYFALGSAVTKVGFAEKTAAGIAEARGGVRGPGNVWGSALVAALCALLILGLKLSGQSDSWVGWLTLGLVASIATKLSDTSATEIGKAYGQRTFLITTLKPVPRGTEGAVSLEGTVAGVVGSIALAAFAAVIGLIAPMGIVICAIAAFVATTIESLIGATLEDRVPGLTHDVVNIINTLIGAAVAVGLAGLLGY
ncbi:MAG: TIGR00297 family protein [Leptolyngbya sp. SIO4C1]|nr:TIGR00297 family protein [Leptolyngbya sp. SIO4C1]